MVIAGTTSGSGSRDILHSTGVKVNVYYSIQVIIMKEIKPEGVVIPLVSPFTESGKIDEKGSIKLIQHIIDNGCHPFVLGTTGESLSIPMKEKLVYLRAAAKANAGRKILYAGISGMCMEETVLLGKAFADEGAEILVAHLPSYYPLPHDYMLRYFIELADALPRPLMLYNITATTHMSIPVDVIKELSKHDNIIGLKDSEQDLKRLDILAAFAAGTEGFYYQLGWAPQSIYALKAGADGIVPSTGNAFPKLYHELYLAVKEGDFEKAETYQLLTDELSVAHQKDKLLSQTLPGLKVMLEDLGICESHCISPCYPLGEQENKNIISQMRQIMERIP
jgi:dihydrodipicolinate synthase/N-acetylneuraminate lyase